ncbi:hypothetical protein H6P81_009486 [Aristolochia fimbriata]|uniref:Uncharacterized protein n=1 Tax=Aristolochia fimbriata TaxID=158543 RepID=A0AAV7EP81_ARIFI|nr:hypothetical protein H6P81_009486 [Aristolochia fimbriata]
MEHLRFPQFSWSCFHQGKSLEELRHALLCTSLELETTRLSAQEELDRKENEIKQLKDLLNRAIAERDEINDKYQGLLLQQQQQQQQQLQQQQVHQQQQQLQQQQGAVPVAEDDGRSEESIVCGSPARSIETIGPLPEKGKLLQAVMKAGPLLQTLLLAGPLPQWRHPPPPLDTIEIPPVAISIEGNLDRSVNTNTRKRALAVAHCTDEDYSPVASVRRQSECVFKAARQTSLIN